ncbi:hypothetical protein J4731_15280 [Providencia rettgeri]|nr:hypothetical protein [Providencia rettgeri]
MLTITNGSKPSKTATNRRIQKQRELRGLFEYNLTGQELDSYVKKEIEHIVNKPVPSV